MSDGLTTREISALAACEATIERGLDAFRAVGDALRQIRDDHLYRATHRTFEDYCRERWGMGRNYANKQIAAADIATRLGTNVPAPTSEAVTRELAPLQDDPDLMRQTWEEAVKTAAVTGRDAPTAAIVKDTVRRTREPPPAPAPSRGGLTRDRAWGRIGRIDEEMTGLERLDQSVIRDHAAPGEIHKMCQEIRALGMRLTNYGRGLKEGTE